MKKCVNQAMLTAVKEIQSAEKIIAKIRSDLIQYSIREWGKSKYWVLGKIFKSDLWITEGFKDLLKGSK